MLEEVKAVLVSTSMEGAVSQEDVSVHETPALAKVVYQPQAQAAEDAVETVEVEEDEPLWQGGRTQVLYLPLSTDKELVAGSLISVDITSRLTDPFWSRQRLPTLKFNAYPVEWESAAEPFLEVKDRLTSFLTQAEAAVESAFLGVGVKQFESMRLWYRVSAVLGSILLIVGVALGVTVALGIFAVAGAGLILLGLGFFYFRPRMLIHWRQIKEDLLDFVNKGRSQLPDRLIPVVGAYGMYLKFRLDLPVIPS